jgi:proteasome lid subunit RPN8/RPN11
MKLPRGLYEQILAHGERAAPEESCGFLLADPDGTVVAVIPIRNAAEQMKAERPDEFTRSASMGYVMDPREQMKAMRDAETAGRTVRGIYHSHVDVGAYFSAEDKRRATLDGEPLFPDAVYVVSDVRAAKAHGAKAFVWDPSAKDYIEEAIQIGD